MNKEVNRIISLVITLLVIIIGIIIFLNVKNHNKVNVNKNETNKNDRVDLDNKEGLETIWNQEYIEEDENQFNSIIETKDGGNVVIGRKYSAETNLNSAILIKYSEEGKIEWQKSIDENIYFSKVINSNDDFIVIGEVKKEDGSSFAIILKYDVEGNIIWENREEVNDDNNHHLQDIIVTDDNGFIVIENVTYLNFFSEYQEDNTFIKKYNSDGVMEWEKKSQIDGATELTSIVKANDDGFYITATIEKKSKDELILESLLAKYNNNGSLLWVEEKLGNSTGLVVTDSIITNDNLLLIVGYTASFMGESPNKGEMDAFIMCYDAKGNKVWEKTWGLNKTDKFHKIVAYNDYSYLVIGQTNSDNKKDFKGENDSVILLYDKKGNIVWQDSWGGNGNDILSDIVVDKNQNIIMVGSTNSKDIDGLKGEESAVILKRKLNEKIVEKIDTSIKIETSFNKKMLERDYIVKWKQTKNDVSNNIFNNIIEIEDGKYIVTGYLSTGNKSYIIKYQNDGLVEWENILDIRMILDLVKVENNNFVVVGINNDIIIMAKYDKDGNLLWKKEEKDNCLDYFKVINIENNEIVTLRWSSNKQTYLIEKYNSVGEKEWQKECKNFNINKNRIHQFKAINNEEFIIIGGIGTYSVSRYNSEGNIIWEKNLGRTFDVEIMPNGEIIRVGVDGNSKAFIGKYDVTGKTIWENKWSGSGTIHAFESIKRNEDNTYTVIGRTSTNDNLIPKYSILTYSEYGTLIEQIDLGNLKQIRLFSFIQTVDNGIIIVGHTEYDKNYNINAIIAKYGLK